MSELELAIYVIDNAVGLNRILIDPRKQSQYRTTFSEFSKNEEAARSSAKPQLEQGLLETLKMKVRGEQENQEALKYDQLYL